MKLIKSLCKISVKYWFHNIQELLILVFAVLLGVASISAALFLIRSNKTTQYETTLSEIGDYDCLVYDTDYETYKFFSNLPEITKIGCYFEQGYIQVPGTGMKLHVSAFPDKQSEELYYAKCIRGRLPISNDEVAVDVSVLGVLGLTPSFELGKKVSFEIYSEDGSLCETKELSVTGYYELSNSNSVGGWIRYPLNSLEEYDHMPSVIMAPNATPSKVVTFFFQSDLGSNELDTFVRNTLKQNGFSYFDFDASRGRVNAMYSVLNPEDKFWEENSFAVDSMNVAVEQGMQRKDLFSSVLIPVFVVLIVIVVAVTVFSIVMNVYMDRSRFYGVMRAIGLTSNRLWLYIIIETLIISLISVALGIGVGSLLHVAMITVVNSMYNLQFEYGFVVNKYVSAVTLNPYVISALTIILAVLCALVFVIIKFSKGLPIVLLNGEFEKKTSPTKRSSRKDTTWLKVINTKISFHSSLVMVIMIIILATGIFGYCFFRAYSDMQSREYSYEVEEDGELSQYDYSITALLQNSQASCFEENHHHFGVKQEAIDSISEADFVEDVFAVIRNRSMRLVYKRDQVSEVVDGIYADRDVHYQPNPQLDEIINDALAEAVNTSLTAMGYDPHDSIYLIWSLGMLRKDIDKLNIVAGKVDYEKMSRGEEVILFVPEYLQDACLDIYAPGEDLPLSDVLIPEEVENMNFSNVDLNPEKMDFYRIVTASDGNEYPVFSYSFGVRKDINTRIGAIAVLDEEEMAKYVGEEYTYPGIICLDNTEFASWGLPNRNYTNLKIKLKDGVDMYEANEIINKALGTSLGLSVRSRLLVYDHIYKSNIKTMIIYYLILFLLVLNGMSGIVMCLYIRIKTMSDRIDALRMLGITNGQVFRIILTQNLYYPVIGTMAGIIPTALVQTFFTYCKNQFESGNWETAFATGEEPWYMAVLDLPYYLNLFSYNFIAVMLICIAIGFVLIILGTLPQMRYITKRKLIS